jgi:hypothetical protein
VAAIADLVRGFVLVELTAKIGCKKIGSWDGARVVKGFGDTAVGASA